MGLTLPIGLEWIADSVATYHTTRELGILSSVHPPSSSHPSSIMVANGLCLPITSVGATSTHGSFRRPNILVAPSMVQNLLSIRRFIADNSCSMEFDFSSLTMKDLASQHPLLLCDSMGPLYTLRFMVSARASASPSSPSIFSAALTATTSSTTWHQRLGHPRHDALMQLSHSSDIHCTRAHDEHLCHACQLGRHVRLSLHSSSSHVACIFYLVHCNGHLLSLAFLAISTILWWLMISLIIHGLFPYVRSLMLSSRSSIFLLGCPLGLASPSRPSSVTMVVSLITPPPMPSSSLTLSICACLAYIPLLRMSRLSA